MGGQGGDTIRAKGGVTVATTDMPVVFLGTQRSISSDNLLPHNHDYYELNYLTSGRTNMKLNDLLLHYEAYDFVLIPPQMPHHLYCAKNELYNNYTISFSGEPQYLSGIFPENHVVKLHDYDGALQFLCSEVFRLQTNYGMENAELFNAYLNLILLHLRRGNAMDTLSLQVREEDPVDRAVRFINENIMCRPLSVRTVADEVKLSPTYFTRLFQRRIGVSPMKYIIEAKMAQAKRMLTEDGGSIREISEALFYENQLYFSRQFSKETGLSPRKYRTEARQT